LKKKTEFQIKFYSFGVKEKEKEDFLKEGDMFGNTVLLSILTHPFFMRHSVKEKKADEVLETAMHSYTIQELKWKSKIQIHHFFPGRIHIFESQIHFKYLDVCKPAFPQGKPDNQFLDTETRGTLYCLA